MRKTNHLKVSIWFCLTFLMVNMLNTFIVYAEPDVKTASFNTIETFDGTKYNQVFGTNITKSEISGQVKYNDENLEVLENGTFCGKEVNGKFQRYTENTINESSQLAKTLGFYILSNGENIQEDAYSEISYYEDTITIRYTGKFTLLYQNESFKKRGITWITKNADGSYNIKNEEYTDTMYYSESEDCRQNRELEGKYFPKKKLLELKSKDNDLITSTITMNNVPYLIFNGIKVGEKEFAYLENINKAFAKGSKNYNYLRKKFVNMESEIDVSSIISECNNDTSVFDRFVTKISEEFPEYWFCIVHTSKSKGKSILRIDYPPKDTVKEMKEKLDIILPKIIKDGMSDYEKEKAIHDYLVANIKYDYENFLNDTIPYHSYRPYGAIVKGTAVCQGYAETFELLCKAVGIECMLVDGKASGDGHAWNIVKIDGQYYQVDVTWDDPVPDKKGRILYDYFNITDEKMGLDHQWDRELYPKCDSTKYTKKK